jgi:hypothetical protein
VDLPFAKDGVDDFADRSAKLVFGDVAAANIEEVLVVRTDLSGAHALDAGVRSKAIEREEQPLLDDLTIKVLLRRCTSRYVRNAGAEIGLFEDIEQACEGPAFQHSHLQCGEIFRFRLHGQGR